ncbi:TPA: hypothetical protein R1765_001967 [Campylobacter coli]|nr:hypothetical protein [Campylobacter coli]
MIGEDIFFIKGLNAVIDQPLEALNTFAKVVEVYNNGYTIDVELVLKSEGLEQYKNIPVLKNAYYNTPIRKDDIVVLLNLSHLQNSFIDTGVLENPVFMPSYFALPFVLKEKFKYTNFFHLATPEGKTTAIANETDVKIENFSGNLLTNFKNTSIESSNLNLQSSNPISIKTTEELGKILIDLINILTTASTELVVAAQGVPHQHKSIDSSSSASLENIINRLQKVLKA